MTIKHITLWTVQHVCQTTYVSGLTREEVVLKIYNDENTSIEVEPAMIYVGDNQETGDETLDGDGQPAMKQDALGGYPEELEWNVLVGGRDTGAIWAKNHDEALAKALLDAFNGTAWDDGNWIVVGDESYQQMLSETAADAE